MSGHVIFPIVRAEGGQVMACYLPPLSRGGGGHVMACYLPHCEGEGGHVMACYLPPLSRGGGGHGMACYLPQTRYIVVVWCTPGEYYGIRVCKRGKRGKIIGKMEKINIYPL